MPQYASLKIEMIDYQNVSGSPYIQSIFTEGTMFSNLKTEFELKFENPAIKNEVPIVIRGMGPSGLSGYRNAGTPLLPDPFLVYAINNSSYTNDNWTGSAQSGRLVWAGLQPRHRLESADLVFPLEGEQTILLYSGAQDGVAHVVNDYRGRIDLIRGTGSGIIRPSQVFSGQGAQAWITYDLTGTNNRSIFAYTVNLVHSISGSQSPLLNIQDHEPSRFVYQSGAAFNSVCNSISLILDVTGRTCLLPEDLQGDPTEICVATGQLSGRLEEKITSILSGLAFFESQKGLPTSNLVDDSEVSINGSLLNYTRYESLLEYNQPIVGDKICFDSYNYDYTGSYSGLYSGAPPYNTIIKCWNFGTDFTNITGLVHKINQDLYDVKSHQLWVREAACWNGGITGSGYSGLYETGSLVKASLRDDNNIFLESQRDGPAGKFYWSVTTGMRSGRNPYYDVIKYLTPTKVTLQGAASYGSWSTINTNDGINWESIRPREIVAPHSFNATGVGEIPAANVRLDVGFSGELAKRLIYTALISGRNRCGEPFSKVVEFYEPINSTTCGADESQENPFDRIFEATTGNFRTSDTPPDVVYNILTTGWKFSNTGNYNYYRLLFEGMVSKELNQDVRVDPSLFVDGINFYAVKTGEILHSGATCVFGANYVADIRGLTTGLLTGTYTGMANGLGKLCLTREVITGQPSPDGRVRFNNLSGRAATNFTGLLTACVTGTGYFLENVIGFFYNAASQCINYSKPVSGTITGSGNLTGGPYNIIRDATMINLTGQQSVTGSGLAQHSGLIYNYNYTFTDEPAWGYLTGTHSLTLATAHQGESGINELKFGLPTQVWSQVVSGTKQGIARLIYSAPAQNDAVIINGFPIVYDAGSTFFAPTYFHSINELTNIINSGSGQFLCTGYNAGGVVHLTSLLLGHSGSGITTTTTGAGIKPAFTANVFTGGQTYHFPLTSYYYFSGYLASGFKGTGFFTASGTGNITGYVKQLDFIRYFTGIWGFTTGDVDYRLSGWITGGSGYQNSGFISLATLSGQPNVIPFSISYNNSPLVFTTDLARLTITGIGAGTGIVLTISGKF